MKTLRQINNLESIPFIAITALVVSALSSLLYACLILKDASAVSMWGIGLLFFIINFSKIFGSVKSEFRFKFIALLLLLVSFGTGYCQFLLLSIFISLIAVVLFYCGLKSTLYAISPLLIWIFGVFNYAQIHIIASYPMRVAEAIFVKITLKLLGVNTEIIGASIFVDSREIIITSACSGVEHIWTLILFALVFAEIKYSTMFCKIISVMTLLPIFIFCNALRVGFVIVCMRYFGEVVLVDKTLHTAFGVSTILIAMLLFVAFGLYFAKLEKEALILEK